MEQKTGESYGFFREIEEHVVHEYKQEIASRLNGIEDFPVQDFAVSARYGSVQGKKEGIWVNPDEQDGKRPKAFILTPAGLFRTTVCINAHPSWGGCPNLPRIDALEQPTADEYIKYTPSAFDRLEQALEKRV